MLQQPWFRQAVAAAVVVVAAVFLVYQADLLPSAVPQAETFWYYDLDTRLLFPARDKLPPIDAPSGLGPDNAPAGVRAYVFACGSCENEKDRFIGYLETIAPEFRAQAAAIGSYRNIGSDALPGLMVRRAERGKWVPHASDEGAEVRDWFATRCQGATPIPCDPPPLP